MIWLLLPVCNWPGGPADWGRSVAISSLPSMCSPSFSFMGGAEKKKESKLGCDNIFARSHTEHRWRCSYSGRSPSNLLLQPKEKEEEEEDDDDNLRLQIGRPTCMKKKFTISAEFENPKLLLPTIYCLVQGEGRTNFRVCQLASHKQNRTKPNPTWKWFMRVSMEAVLSTPTS